jgi:hypothetical protein
MSGGQRPEKGDAPVLLEESTARNEKRPTFPPGVFLVRL